MSQCCHADEYDRVFTGREARSRLNRFRRKGLTGSERQLADAVTATGISGTSVLEVGGGLGALAVSLLERGAASATAVELSTSWDGPAETLVRERGLDGRVTRLTGDAVEVLDELEPHDAVVAHRVVCCYPEWRSLVRSMTGRAGRVIGLTFPRDAWWVRSGLAAGNLLFGLSRLQFRAYLHDPKAMLETMSKGGFELVDDRPGFIWRTVVLTRRPGTGGVG